MNNNSRIKNTMAVSLGSFLELFEFSLYGIYAQLFSKIFFDEQDSNVSIAYSLGIFAVGFLARPIGAFIFGHIGDKYGRVRSLLISIPIMFFSTFSIGLLPTYQEIGIAAPLLLLVLRILQGISVGGEYNGATVYLTELLPDRKELAGAIVSASGMSGTLCAILLSYYSFQGLWSWRFPFLCSIFISLVIIYLRYRLVESTYFDYIMQRKRTSTYPIVDVFKKHRRNLFSTILVGGANGIFTFHFIVYLNIFITTFCGASTEISLFFNAMSILCFIIFCVFLGMNVRIKQNKPILLVLSLIMILVSPLLYLLLITQCDNLILFAEIIFGLLAGGFSGIINSFMCRLFPAHVKYTGVALGYSLGVAVFGGTVPVICNFLIHSFHSNLLSPCLYLAFGGLMAISGIMLGKTCQDEDF